MATRMQQRRGTAADWAAANPVLADGEIGFETDTKVIKIGDGVTAWNALAAPYIPKAIVDAAGDLIIGTGDDTVGRLAKGTAGQYLMVLADGSLGWDDSIAIIDAAGDLIVGTADDTPGRLPKGATGQRLTVQSDGTLAWSNTAEASAAGVVPLVVKGAAGQTADLTQFQTNSDTRWRISNNGDLVSATGLTALWSEQSGAGQAQQMKITPSAAAVAALRLVANSGQTANILEIRNNAQTANFFRVGPTGLVEALQGFQSTSPGTGTVPLITKGFTGQTADLFQALASDGTISARISPTGATSLGSGALTSARLNVRTVSVNSVGVGIQRMPSQVQDLLELLHEDGSTVLAKFDKDGNLTLPGGIPPITRVAGSIYTGAAQSLGVNTETMLTPFNDFQIVVPTGGARYRMYCVLQLQSTAANDVCNIRLRDGGASAPTVASNQITIGRKQLYPTANTSAAIELSGVEFDLTAGTHRLGITVIVVNGTGSHSPGAGFISSVSFDKVS